VKVIRAFAINLKGFSQNVYCSGDLDSQFKKEGKKALKGYFSFISPMCLKHTSLTEEIWALKKIIG